MHCCKKLLRALLRAALTVWLFSATAHAEGISANKAEVRSSEEGYQLSASYDVKLNFVVKQALSRGIPIYFVGEFSLTHARWGWLDSAQQALSRSMPRFFSGGSPLARWSWLDKEIFSSEQTVKLSYSILTGRYRISRGALFQNFASLEDALNILARQSSAVIPADARCPPRWRGSSLRAATVRRGSRRGCRRRRRSGSPRRRYARRSSWQAEHR